MKILAALFLCFLCFQNYIAFAQDPDAVADADDGTVAEDTSSTENASSGTESSAKESYVEEVEPEKSVELPQSASSAPKKSIPPLIETNPNLRPLAKTLRKGAYQLQFDHRRFVTQSTFDEGGSEVPLASNASFAKQDNDFLGSYGYSNQLELRAGGRFRQIQAEHYGLSITNNGIESAWIGLRYMFSNEKKNKSEFTFDCAWRQTAYATQDYNRATDVPRDEIVLGDDSSSLLVGLLMSYVRTPTHFLNFSGHYHQPGRDLSNELLYSADSSWIFGPLSLGLGLRGIISMQSDEDKDDLNNRPLRATDPTRLFNSVNRENTVPFFNAKLAFNKWAIGLEYAQIYKGVWTDKGQELTLSLSWNSIGESAEKIRDQQFKEYDIEASVIKVSPRGKFISVDHGAAQDVEKGMKFDIFQTDYFGGNTLVAEAICYEVSADTAILKVVKTYREIPIEKGFVARAH